MFSFLVVFSFLNGSDFDFGLSCKNLTNKSTSQLNVCIVMTFCEVWINSARLKRRMFPVPVSA